MAVCLINRKGWNASPTESKILDIYAQLGDSFIDALGLALKDRPADFPVWRAEMLKASGNDPLLTPQRLAQMWDRVSLQKVLDRVNVLKDPKPFMQVVAQKGFIRGTDIALKNGYNTVRDITTVDAAPRLQRALADDFMAAVRAATARQAIPAQVRGLLSKVFGAKYKDAVFMAEFGDLAVKDDILGGYRAMETALAKTQAALAAALQKHAAAEAVLAKTRRSDPAFDQAYRAREQAKSEVAQLRAKITKNTPKLAAVDNALAARGETISSITRDVMLGRANPDMVAAFDGWKREVLPVMDDLYRTLKNVDDDFQLTGRGLVFGSRVNLLPIDREAGVMEWFMDEEKPIAESSNSASYRRTNVGRDPFDQSASFANEDGYSVNPAAMLANMFGERSVKAAKMKFYEALVEHGYGSMDKVDKVAGEKAAPLPMKLPETTVDPKTGIASTRMVEHTMWIPKSLVAEARGIIDTDLPISEKKGMLGAVLQSNTAVAIVGAAEGLKHLQNIHSVIVNALGRGRALDILERMVPTVTSYDALARIGGVMVEGWLDTPRNRAEMQFLAENGMLRSKVKAAGALASLGRPLSHLLHVFDTAGRIVANRFYDDMIGRGVNPSLASRRAFVQTIGEYNSRLSNQNTLQSTLKATGLSSFITAGKTYNRLGRRVLTGSSGMEFTNLRSAGEARMINLLSIMAPLTAAGIWNWMLTGKPGGRDGTRLGELDLNGPMDPVTGKHDTLYLFGPTNVGRGLTNTGIEAQLEGGNAGESLADIGQGLMRPYAGPGLTLFNTLLGGARPGGIQLKGTDRSEQPRKMEGTGEQLLEDARAILQNTNKPIYALGKGAVGLFSPGSSTRADVAGDAWKDLKSTPMHILGFNERSSSALNLAKSLAGQGMKPTTMEKSDEARLAVKLAGEWFDDVTKEKLAPAEARQKQIEYLADRGLSLEDSNRAMQRAGKRVQVTPLEFYVARLDAGDAFDVWNHASPEERHEIRNAVAGKILRSTDLKPEDKLLKAATPGLLEPKTRATVKTNLERVIQRREAKK